MGFVGTAGLPTESVGTAGRLKGFVATEGLRLAIAGFAFDFAGC